MFWIVVALVVLDLSDVRSRVARAWWGLIGAHPTEDPQAEAWRIVSRRGRPVSTWPRRLLLGTDREAILCAFEDGGETPSGAWVLQPGRSAEVRVAGPTIFKLIPLSGERAVPRVTAVSPVGVLLSALREGLSFTSALARAWPTGAREAPAISDASYRRWIETVEPTVLAGLATTAGMSVSVIMPVHDPDPDHLAAACRSVLDQSGVGLTLCICDDGSTDPRVRAFLGSLGGHRAVRMIRHEQARGIAAATRAALDLAEGDLAAFVDHDDVLAPGALAAMAANFTDPEIQAVYSDEDTIDHAGRRSRPVFKTAFDAERIRAHNFVNHLLMVRRAVVSDVGGLGPGVDGVQDHDLVLRILDRFGPEAIRHLPAILYHWRSFPGGESFSQRRREQIEGARRAIVAEHLTRQDDHGVPGIDERGRVVIVRDSIALPRVTIVIPTADQPDLISACVGSLLSLTDYPAMSIMVVDNGRTGRATEALVRISGLPNVEVIRRPGPFNHSALNNEAVAAATADVVVLMNDDVFAIQPGWLRVMALEALRPGVGAVGARLLYPDGRLQHAGVIAGLGRDRVAGHEMRGAPARAEGLQGRLAVQRRVDAVTAACLAIEREKFVRVGGFDAEVFPIAFNDVDLCLRLEAAGLETIWTPHATLIHAESVSRGRADNPAAVARFQQDVARMRARWAARLDAGRDFHPALSRDEELTTLSLRPGAGGVVRPR